MDTIHREAEVRWVFAALVFLGVAVTATLFNGLQVA